MKELEETGIPGAGAPKQKAMEERGMDEIFQLLEEENKVFTKTASQIT